MISIKKYGKRKIDHRICLLRVWLICRIINVLYYIWTFLHNSSSKLSVIQKNISNRSYSVSTFIGRYIPIWIKIDINFTKGRYLHVFSRKYKSRRNVNMNVEKCRMYEIHHFWIDKLKITETLGNMNVIQYLRPRWLIIHFLFPPSFFFILRTRSFQRIF